MSEIFYNSTARDRERLLELQALPLEQKIQITMARIIEWYDRWNGKVFIAFSGGKDSTVLLYIARKLFPDIPAVFSDTGLEYPEIREFVRTIDNVIWLKPQMNFRKVIETYGYPLISKEVSQKIEEYRKNPRGGAASSFDTDSERIQKYGDRYDYSKWTWLRDSDIPISAMCCDIMKKYPSRRYAAETGSYPIVGTTAEESLRRTTSWIQHGCNNFDSRHPTSRPLSVWKEQDIIEYIYEHNVPYSPIYGRISHIGNYYHMTGAQRTGCMFCPLGVQCEKSPNRFQRMKTTHPQIYDYCMRSWKDGGLGLREIFDRIGVPTE